MYQLVDKFDSANGWEAFGANLFTNYWEFLVAGRVNPSSIGMEFVSENGYASKKFDPPVSLISRFGIPFTELSFFALRRAGAFGGPERFLSRKDFEVRLSVKRSGAVLREWLLPVSAPRGIFFSEIALDLAPLTSAGHTEFDEIVFSANRPIPSDVAFYLTNLILRDRDMEHSLKETVKELLHERLAFPVGKIAENYTVGEKDIQVSSDAPLFADMLVQIGEGRHKIAAVAPISENVFSLTFTEDFSGAGIIQDVRLGDPLILLVPATFKEIADADSVYPTFFISGQKEYRQNSERAVGGHQSLGPYVYSGPDGQDTVGIRRAGKAYEFPLQIHIYAHSVDAALEMRNFAHDVFDENRLLNIAGSFCDYQTEALEPLETWDSVESAPHSIIRLTVWLTENIKSINYRNFPPVKSVTVGVVSRAVTV